MFCPRRTFGFAFQGWKLRTAKSQLGFIRDSGTLAGTQCVCFVLWWLFFYCQALETGRCDVTPLQLACESASKNTERRRFGPWKTWLSCTTWVRGLTGKTPKGTGANVEDTLLHEHDLECDIVDLRWWSYLDFGWYFDKRCNLHSNMRLMCGRRSHCVARRRWKINQSHN